MSNNLKIYCVTDKPLKKLENSNLNLAGVGKNFFSDRYISSDEKININSKERHYSELTFHYWFWKNLLENEKSEWIGFCQKRRFWIKENFVGTNTIHKVSFDGGYEFDNFRKIGFSTSRNKNINFTEYYDAYYQYQNDCLTAKIAYNKSFYEDRDIKPNETLFLSLTIIPLVGYDSRNLLGGY